VEKLIKSSAAAIQANLTIQERSRAAGDATVFEAPSTLVAPLIDLFNKSFVWTPGEYLADVEVEVERGPKIFRASYSFTIFESDTAELVSHANNYRFGNGITDPGEHYTGSWIRLSQR